MTTDQLIAELLEEAGPQPRSADSLPPMVNQETLLGELGQETLRTRYILVTDDADRIVGVVLSEEIRQRFASGNNRERDRWAGMPLSHLISVAFPADAEILTDSVSAVRPGHSSGELDSTACIATESDLFLSWERLSSALASAISDSLTGLPNRMACDRRLKEEWSRSQRTECSIGVILIDLDYFKTVNDQHGHAVGDAVLQDVAQRLEQSLRSYDLVVRYGGDEFIALCLGCEPGEIEIPIRRIMDSLRDSTVLEGFSQAGIQASIGAAVQHCAFQSVESKDLFRQADQSLYLAKVARGRGVYIDILDHNPTYFTIEAGSPAARPFSSAEWATFNWLGDAK